MQQATLIYAYDMEAYLKKDRILADQDERLCQQAHGLCDRTGCQTVIPSVFGSGKGQRNFSQSQVVIILNIIMLSSWC
jgi:hypothetical protein